MAWILVVKPPIDRSNASASALLPAAPAAQSTGAGHRAIYQCLLSIGMLATALV